MVRRLHPNSLALVEAKLLNTILPVVYVPVVGIDAIEVTTLLSGNIVLSSLASTNAKLLGWRRLTTGSTHVLNTDWLEITSGITLSTSQASTSGTAINFTGIPSWAKRVTITCSNLSTNGTSDLFLRLGNGAVIATGYLSSTSSITGTVAASNLATTGFSFTQTTGVVAAATFNHTFVLNLIDVPTFRWVCTGLGSRSDTGVTYTIAGSLTLTSVLDRISITTANGTDLFDLGLVNMSYE